MSSKLDTRLGDAIETVARARDDVAMTLPSWYQLSKENFPDNGWQINHHQITLIRLLTADPIGPLYNYFDEVNDHDSMRHKLRESLIEEAIFYAENYYMPKKNTRRLSASHT